LSSNFGPSLKNFRSLDVGRPPQPQTPVGERRVQDDEVAVALRRARLVYQRHVAAYEPFGVLLGVGDGSGGQQELRRRAVVGGDAPEPPQDVRDVRAEDAAVGVELVDDDVAQRREEAAPARVVRQDAGVEHVRVGDEEVGAVAELAARGRGRVAVVDAGRDARGHRRREREEPVQVAELVLAQRLGGVEEERGAATLVVEALEHRQQEAVRLAGGGGRDGDDVLAGAGSLDELGLVAVELGDAQVAQGLGERRRERRLELAVARLARRDVLDVADGVALGELQLGEYGVDFHSSSSILYSKFTLRFSASVLALSNQSRY
jgi:hypothetical protein